MEYATPEFPPDPHRPASEDLEPRRGQTQADRANQTEADRPVTQDQAARVARLAAAPNEHNATAERAATPRHRQHPAQGARAAALVASITATAGIGAAMAYADVTQDTEIAAPAAPLVFPTIGSFQGPELAELAAASTETALDVAASNKPAAESTSEAVSEAPSESQTPDSVSAGPVVEPESQSTGYSDGVFAGTSEYTRWGNVQVEISITDGEIVDIKMTRMPNDRISKRLNRRAEVRLEAQALATQHGELDIVSGATYTSETYEDSLQAALDQAAIASQPNQTQQ